MITAERIEELKALGYCIEDMGKEYGSGFTGQYRWIKRESRAFCDFQDWGTSDCEADAWADADLREGSKQEA